METISRLGEIVFKPTLPDLKGFKTDFELFARLLLADQSPTRGDFEGRLSGTLHVLSRIQRKRLVRLTATTGGRVPGADATVEMLIGDERHSDLILIYVAR